MKAPNLFRHSEDGFYCLLNADAPLKHPDSGEWCKGVIYIGTDGQMRSTTLHRWATRFEPWPEYDGEDEEVLAMIRRSNPDLDFKMEDVWASWHEAESTQTAALIEATVACALAAQGWGAAGMKVVPVWADEKLLSMTIDITAANISWILANFDIETTPVADGYRFTVSNIT